MKSVLIVATMLVAWWSVVCESADNGVALNDDPYAVSYLEATVEPCARLPDSQVDPCERDRFNDYDWWIDYHHPEQLARKSAPEVEYKLIYPPITTQQSVRSAFATASRSVDRDYGLPHIVARGVFLPGTTRCAVYDCSVTVGTGDPRERIGYATQQTWRKDYVGCFIEFGFREYLFGKGPATLTLHPRNSVLYHHRNHEFYKTEQYLSGLASHVADLWEGAEVVVRLATHTNAAVEVWRASDTKIVQQDSNGRVVLMALGKNPYGPEYPSEPYVDRIEPTLDDYRRDIQIAFEESATEFDLTPIADANQKHLRAHVNRFGIYNLPEIEIVQPPPPPNE